MASEATIHKNKIKYALKLMLYCIAVVFFTISGKIYVTISTTLEDFWVQYQSPYDLHSEFIMNKLLSSHRPDIHLLTFGLLDDWATKKHKQIVELVKNKIPASDDAWIEYWYDSEAKFWPYDDKERSAERIPLALKYMDILMTGDSKVVQFNKAWRYNIWADLAYYVANNEYQSAGDYSDKYVVMDKFIKDSETIYKRLDIEYLLKQDDIEVILPFRMLSNRHHLYGYLIQMQQNYNKLICSSVLVNNYRANISNILNMSAQYNHVIYLISKRLRQKISNFIISDIKGVKIAQYRINQDCPTGK